MKRQRMKVIGSALYARLPGDIRWDVALVLTDDLERSYKTKAPHPLYSGTMLAMTILDGVNARIPLVSIDPRKLNACPRLTGKYHTGTVFKYEQAYLRGEQFPPIVIDSRAREMLGEGSHRACAAERAGIAEIEAFDVGLIDLRPLVTYHRKIVS